MSDNQTINGGIHIAGGSGQVAVGQGINQIGTIAAQQVIVGTGNTQTVGAARPEITQADLAALRQALADLKAQVEAQAPPEKKNAAIGHVDELEEAVIAKEPDLTTMEYIKRWFAKNLPELAGAVTSVVIHPIVGKLVEAAGDALAAEFRHRFGEE